MHFYIIGLIANLLGAVVLGAYSQWGIVAG
jgi:hypothetical protein